MAPRETRATSGSRAAKGTSRRVLPRPRKRPKTVPVASRDGERGALSKAGTGAAKGIAFPKQDLRSVLILLAVVLLVLFAIAAPLRNYYEGRAEIARAQDSIANLEAQKQQLEEDIAMYENEEFTKQEARRRLGAVDEGETVWRIVDPRMTAGETITTGREDIVDGRGVPEVLWDSLREIPEPQHDEAEPEAQPPAADTPPPPTQEAPAGE